MNEPLKGKIVVNGMEFKVDLEVSPKFVAMVIESFLAKGKASTAKMVEPKRKRGRPQGKTKKPKESNAVVGNTLAGSIPPHLENQPISELPNVNTADLETLSKHGITTLGELANTSIGDLSRKVCANYSARYKRIAESCNTLGIKLARARKGRKKIVAALANDEQPSNQGGNLDPNDREPIRRMIDDGIAPAFADTDDQKYS